MIGLLTLSCLIALILLVWFNSDFVYHWGRLFWLSRLLKLHEYENDKLKNMDSPLSYPIWLKMKSDSFFIHLITCRVCLSIWLSIIISSVFSLIVFSPLLCITSLILYGTTVRLLQLT